MVQSFALSTDHIATRDRYAFWKESISRQITGMSLERPKEKQAKFWARIHGARVAGGAMLDFERTGDLVHRAAEDIRRHPSDNLLIYMAPQTPSWFHAHGAHEFVAAPGQIVVGYSDVPFSQAPVGGVDYRCLLLSLPLRLVGTFRREKRVALPHTIPTDRGLGALLYGQFDSLNRNLPYLSAEAAEIACSGVAQLAALAQGSIGSQHETSRAAIGDGQIAAVERMMAARAHRADLTPEAVADQLGISVRRLHALLEPTGKTFSSRLRELRLSRARALLRDQAALPVTEVAFRCGFDNLATFYRLFKSTVGVTATEYRQAARERAH